MTNKESSWLIAEVDSTSCAVVMGVCDAKLTGPFFGNTSMSRPDASQTKQQWMGTTQIERTGSLVFWMSMGLEFRRFACSAAELSECWTLPLVAFQAVVVFVCLVVPLSSCQLLWLRELWRQRGALEKLTQCDQFTTVETRIVLQSDSGASKLSWQCANGTCVKAR